MLHHFSLATLIPSGRATGKSPRWELGSRKVEGLVRREIARDCAYRRLVLADEQGRGLSPEDGVTFRPTIGK